MTRDELIAALRERVVVMQPEFPELHERARTIPGQRLLESYCRCGPCGQLHIKPDELVSLAASFDRVDDAFMAATQTLALARVPERCLRETDRLHAAIKGSRN